MCIRDSSSTVLTKSSASSEGCKAPKGVTHDHRRTLNPLVHIGHELITPEGTAIVEAGRLGTATKAKQINRVDRMAAGQHGNVMSPMIGGCSKAVDQQKSREIGGDRLIRLLTHRMHGMAEMAPGADLHDDVQEERC